MFEFVRKHTRILQFVLVLLIFPSFVLFGIQGYSGLTEGGNATVATVGSRKIKQAELDAAHRRQVDMLRQQMPGIDVALFDTPQMKRNTLDGLVREQVMLAAAEKAGYVTTDDRLLREYMTDRQFDTFRRPDGSLNVQALEQALNAQGLTKQGYDQLKREELMMRQVQGGMVNTVVAPSTAVASAMDALFQQREVQLQRFDTKDYLSKVNPTDADLEAYYKNPAHAAEFQLPEKADVEYVVLDLETIKKGINVPEDELKKYYSENEKNYTTAEERRASHILIKAPSSMPAAERTQARAKADALLAELTKAPASFADVARKNSQDSSTAATGGDADLFIARGDTEKAYEDALFALKKPGELSPVVETKDGFFILQLKATRGGEKRPYESVRADIEQQRKNQLAQAEYAKAAADFGNVVYEQSDSLKPAVDKFKLELRTAKGVTRLPQQDASGPLGSKKLLDAIFNAEALRNKRNTEAVETAPNTLVSARVVNYQPAATPPLAEVKSRVREKVVAQQAAALARKEGEARLAELQKAPATDLGTPTKVVSRAQAQDVPRPVVDAVLKVPTVPAVEGVSLDDEGYVVAKVTKVLGRDPSTADAARASSSYAQAWASAEAQAYYAALKSRFKVEVHTPAAASAPTK
ncbi:SurA N-terminal domain-containing protein [Piscinibacter sp. HJYY11]|uniref:SurA N-terminal domain-containing protein n=1 Tax=Piscinibacter sp. HJYY11 TaxID=2801333 RepID=UPI00191F4581|nr:SurA N-terminal domain-containing protein [Piscinibacter sp. HJYY11]MBL0731083.1 SurA N-terminal domain-containing protein [Piscinibacter sp. HJYY11]